MELQFGELALERLAAEAVTQALVEGELPMPAGRHCAAILAQEGSALVTGVAVGEGNVTVEGRVRAELLCADGEDVFGTAASAAFRHSFPVKEAAGGMKAEVSLSLEGLTVEAGERPRLSSVLEIRCMLLHGTPLKVLAGCRGAEAPEWHKETLTTVHRDTLGRETVSMREEVRLPGAERVIRAGGVFAVRSLRLGGDTALVEGELALHALCADGEGRLMELQQHIPTAFEVEAEGMGREQENCTAVAEVESLTLSPVEGESGLLVAEAHIAVTLTAAEAASFEVPLAAYVPGLPLADVRERAVFLLRGKPLALRFGAAETLQVPEGMPACARVVACTARPLLTGTAAEEGRLRAEGLLFTRILAETEDGLLFSFTEDIPFRAETAVPAFAQGAWAQACTISAGAAGTGRSLSFSYTLLLKAEPYALCEREVVTSLAQGDDVPQEKGLVLYFAGEGETLFDVGRRFLVSKSRLAAMNPEAGETLREGERLVLFL